MKSHTVALSITALLCFIWSGPALAVDYVLVHNSSKTMMMIDTNQTFNPSGQYQDKPIYICGRTFYLDYQNMVTFNIHFGSGGEVRTWDGTLICNF